MPFNCDQFRDLISRTLQAYGLYSLSAVNLLLGTAAQESAFGTYLRQIRGPALGVFQMEPGTFEWLTRKYKSSYPYLIGRRVEELEYNIDLAILMARLRYRVVPEPLPDPNDVQALARYWKLHYNTIEGRGTEREFMENYHKYIGAI